MTFGSIPREPAFGAGSSLVSERNQFAHEVLEDSLSVTFEGTLVKWAGAGRNEDIKCGTRFEKSLRNSEDFEASREYRKRCFFDAVDETGR